MLHCSLTTITTIVYFDMCNLINSCSSSIAVVRHRFQLSDTFSYRTHISVIGHMVQLLDADFRSLTEISVIGHIFQLSDTDLN